MLLCLSSGCWSWQVRSHVHSQIAATTDQWETTFGKQCSLSWADPVSGHEVRCAGPCRFFSGCWASFVQTEGRQGRWRKGGREVWWAGRRWRRLANQVSALRENLTQEKPFRHGFSCVRCSLNIIKACVICFVGAQVVRFSNWVRSVCWRTWLELKCLSHSSIKTISRLPWFRSATTTSTPMPYDRWTAPPSWLVTGQTEQDNTRSKSAISFKNMKLSWRREVRAYQRRWFFWKTSKLASTPVYIW